MATVTDLFHDVVGYLVTQCEANPVLGGASPPVIVIDGPTPPGEPGTILQQLWIGFDAETGGSGPVESGSAAQRWPFLGQSGAYREETGSVTCTAQAWSGDTNPATARAQCKALVGAVEVTLRGAPSTGGPGDSSMGGLVQWSQVDAFTWYQRQDGSGYSAVCVFRVTYLARLSP